MQNLKAIKKNYFATMWRITRACDISVVLREIYGFQAEEAINFFRSAIYIDRKACGCLLTPCPEIGMR